MDMFTDDNSASPDIFNQLDTFDAIGAVNLEAFNTVNIPRGFHEIHIKTNGLPAGSVAFVLNPEQTTFTKIVTVLDAENDDNSDGSSGIKTQSFVNCESIFNCECCNYVCLMRLQVLQIEHTQRTWLTSLAKS